MGEATTMYIMIPQGIARKKAVQKADEVLMRHGAEMDTSNDSLFFLGSGIYADSHDELYLDEPQAITNKADIMRQLIEWPTMGCIDYHGEGGYFNLAFDALPRQTVTCISIGIDWSRSFSADKAIQAWYQKVGLELHQSFEAKRSFMTWGLNLMNDFSILEELARLQKGIVDSSFSFDYFDLGEESIR